MSLDPCASTRDWIERSASWQELMEFCHWLEAERYSSFVADQHIRRMAYMLKRLSPDGQRRHAWISGIFRVPAVRHGSVSWATIVRHALDTFSPDDNVNSRFAPLARTCQLRTCEAGFSSDARAIEVHSREDRVAVRMPHDRMAWFPSNQAGLAMLTKDRRVLRLLERYCHFSTPRLLYEDETGWDVRALVKGAVHPRGLSERIAADPTFARAFGEDLGRILADQHTCIPPGELTGWLPAFPNWPRPEDLPHLADVIDDPILLARIDQALDRRAEIRSALQDPVLIHADVGLHNIAVDPVSFRVVGLFDYEGAVFGDRHQDFAYMVFPTVKEPMLEGARAVYEAATGVKIDRDRVRLMNAVAAIGFLAFRRGHPPEEIWCGRTLAQDLAWTYDALVRAGIK